MCLPNAGTDLGHIKDEVTNIQGEIWKYILKKSFPVIENSYQCAFFTKWLKIWRNKTRKGSIAPRLQRAPLCSAFSSEKGDIDSIYFPYRKRFITINWLMIVSQDLQREGWRPQRASSLAPAQPWKAEKHESPWCEFQPEPESEGRRRLIPQLEDSHTQRAFSLPQHGALFRSPATGMRPAHPRGGQSILTRSTDLNVHLI